MYTEVFAHPEGCGEISDMLGVYSNMRDTDYPFGTTNYFMGNTRTVINGRGQSYGLGNVGTSSDMCR